jgi:hypothetical protein
MSQENSPSSAAAKRPSIMRYEKVQAILDSEPALKDYLGPKDQEVVDRNNEKHFYSRGTVLVINELQDRGFDAHQAPKPTVLLLASKVLRDKAQKASSATPEPELKRPRGRPRKVPLAPVSQPEVKRPRGRPRKIPLPLVSQPEPVKRPRGRPRKVPLAPESEPPELKKPRGRPRKVPLVPEPEVKKRRGRPPKKIEAAKSESTAQPAVAAPVVNESAPAVSDAAPIPDSSVNAVPATEMPKTGFVYYIYGTALGLAVTLHRTLEIGDRMPGAEIRLESVGKIIDQLKPMANVGVPMPDDFNSAMKHDASGPKS